MSTSRGTSSSSDSQAPAWGPPTSEAPLRTPCEAGASQIPRSQAGAGEREKGVGVTAQGLLWTAAARRRFALPAERAGRETAWEGHTTLSQPQGVRPLRWDGKRRRAAALQSLADGEAKTGRRECSPSLGYNAVAPREIRAPVLQQARRRRGLLDLWRKEWFRVAGAGFREDSRRHVFSDPRPPKPGTRNLEPLSPLGAHPSTPTMRAAPRNARRFLCNKRPGDGDSWTYGEKSGSGCQVPGCTKIPAGAPSPTPGTRNRSPRPPCHTGPV